MRGPIPAAAPGWLVLALILTLCGLVGWLAWPHHDGESEDVWRNPDTYAQPPDDGRDLTDPPPRTTTSVRASRAKHSLGAAQQGSHGQLGMRVASYIGGSQRGQRTVTSTAYCLLGLTADGGRPYNGSAAMNGVPFGSRWLVHDGPMAGRTLVVNDRIGHSSGFDIAMPGDCGAAKTYGRHTITIERVS